MRRAVSQVVRRVNTTAAAPRTQNFSEPNIVKSPYRDIVIPKCTINDFVWQNLDKWPDKTATVCGVTGHGYTYEQTYKLSVTFGASLRTKLKLVEGDSVAILLPNIPEYPCTLLGILQAGCVATLMNPAYTAYELKHLLGLAECKAVVTSKQFYPNIKEALDSLKMNCQVILIENEDIPSGTIKFAELAEDLSIDTSCLKYVQRNPNDTAIVPFSSGTTGMPKGVALTHASALAMHQMILDQEISCTEEASENHQEVLPALLPFFHIFGFHVLMLNQLHLGSKLVTLPQFKPELFLETLTKHKANILYLVPPMVLFMGKHPAVTSKHLESVHSIVCGAAATSIEDIQTVLNKKKDLCFRQGYGLTETNGVVSIGKKKSTNYGSVGHVVGGCELKIADCETQEALGPNKKGEIWFRGPNLMTGYLKNPTETAESLTTDGWYRTGDIGKIDDDNYLYVTDRMKELIKVKGFQVPPAEIEAIIRTHPQVFDCAVIGVPDSKTGEAPKAFVVSKPGQEIKINDILEFVNNKVSSHKRLKQLQFIDAVPKSQAGKILRRVLKEKYC